ncbi:MAG: pro-sigmaK processing inhibitor BofA family protein [Eubacteriales bacterium]|nr:pro-sigmaK processing inhibitor BofA family protein [Eubacteriales bacterium]
MKTWQMLVVIGVVLLVFTFIYFLCKKKKPLKRAFLSMLLGVLSLIAVDLSGIYTGVFLPISALSLSVSAVFGIPGVASMLVIANFL